jgi:release factor glutamine methyltransferase
MIEAFSKADIDSPRLSAEILLAHVIDCDRLRLYMDNDRPASPDERERLRDIVRRALTHEPIQYLVGEWSFFGCRILCDKRALIPRPATETAVEHVLQHIARSDHGPVRRIADVCTGTGCIAIALAKNLPELKVVATDISADAIALAASNVELHGLSTRIALHEGDLLEPLAGERFDVIITNPPYIPDHEWGDVLPNVKNHEPHLALRGGTEGLDLIQRIITAAPDHLEPGGWLIIESAASTTDDVAGLCRDRGFNSICVLDDHEGMPRVVCARRSVA